MELNKFSVPCVGQVRFFRMENQDVTHETEFHRRSSKGVTGPEGDTQNGIDSKILRVCVVTMIQPNLRKISSSQNHFFEGFDEVKTIYW